MNLYYKIKLNYNNYYQIYHLVFYVLTILIFNKIFLSQIIKCESPIEQSERGRALRAIMGTKRDYTLEDLKHVDFKDPEQYRFIGEWSKSEQVLIIKNGGAVYVDPSY